MTGLLTKLALVVAMNATTLTPQTPSIGKMYLDSVPSVQEPYEGYCDVHADEAVCKQTTLNRIQM